jgi:ATP-dependent Lon protease
MKRYGPEGDEVPGFEANDEGLLIPNGVARGIEKQRAEARAREEAEDLLEALARDQAREAEAQKAKTSGSSTGGSSWQEPFENEPNRHQILKRAQVAVLDKGNDKTVDSDLRRRNEKLAKTIRAKGQYRKLATLPPKWGNALDRLERDFPNFREVIASLRAAFTIAQLTDRTVRFDPMVLDGPPGVGKSLFAARLAALLATPLKRINMEAQQSGSAISGSDDFWANSKTGAVFELLIEGDVANAIIFVDEIEKAGGDSRYDPLGGFYCLLERETAKTFRDLSVPCLELDASRLLWICTSNEISRAPKPIQSRLRIFRIPSPTPDQARVIARIVFRNVLAETGLRRIRPLGDDVLDALSNLAPRLMRKTLAEAIGNAVCARRRHVRLDDLPAALNVAPVPAVPPTSLEGFHWRPRSLVIFTDIPGVLHPWSPADADTYRDGVPQEEPIELRFAQVLRDVLAHRQEVALVLTNGHRYQYPVHVLKTLLGPGLGDRLIGLTPYLRAPTPLEIAHYVAVNGIVRWIAIDDETVAWPSGMHERVVQTDSRTGLGDVAAVARLQELLARYGDH